MRKNDLWKITVAALALALVSACGSEGSKSAGQPVVDLNPVIGITPTPTPVLLPTPTATPPFGSTPTPVPTATPEPTPIVPTPTPVPTATPTPTPNPEFHTCHTPDQSIYIDFYRIVTPYGLRTYVTADSGQYHVFTKPFCEPTPQLFAAAVSYVNPNYLHVKFPKQQTGTQLQGTAYICMGDLCPGEKPIVCDLKVRAFFEKICGMGEDLTSFDPDYLRADRRFLEDWIHSHEGRPLR